MIAKTRLLLCFFLLFIALAPANATRRSRSEIEFKEMELQDVTVLDDLLAEAPYYFKVNASEPGYTSLSINAYCEDGCQTIIELNVSTNPADFEQKTCQWIFKVCEL